MIRAMMTMVLAGIASVVAVSPANAGIPAPLAEPANYTLLALGLAGLVIGWHGARKRPRD